jgi:lysophospholipase L1-like esterase
VLHRVAASVVAVVTVIVLAGVVYVFAHGGNPPTDAGQALGAPTQTAGSSALGPSAPVSGSDPAPPSGSADGGTPTVAFLGDDWTVGSGASTKAKRWTSLVSKALDLHEVNLGVEGAGYAQKVADDGSYSGQVAGAVKADPDVVVVSGGRNDAYLTPATVKADATELFADLHAKLPRARIVAVAPFWGDSAFPAPLTAIAKTIRTAVTAAGGTYLDIADPIRGHPEDMSDAADPDDSGYAAVAKAVEPELRPLLSSS